MNRDDCQPYYAILELTSDASPVDVRKAYLFLKELYSTESIVTVPLENEISPDEQRQIVIAIEEAYRKLSVRAEQRSSPGGDSRRAGMDCASYNGQVLRQIRQQLNIHLQDMALATNIQTQYLEDIENENYEALPVYVYTRGYVANYAKFLCLDHQKVTEDYMSRFTAWRKGN
jgi:hypothetical protein